MVRRRLALNCTGGRPQIWRKLRSAGQESLLRFCKRSQRRHHRPAAHSNCRFSTPNPLCCCSALRSSCCPRASVAYSVSLSEYSRANVLTVVIICRAHELGISTWAEHPAAEAQIVTIKQLTGHLAWAPIQYGDANLKVVFSVNHVRLHSQSPSWFPTNRRAFLRALNNALARNRA